MGVIHFSNLQAYQCFAGTVFTDDSCYGGSASTAGIGVCTVGKIACTGGVITGCEGEVLPSAEICDGVDNDCDGLSDDDDLSLDTSTYNIYYLDSDGDGYGTLVTKESACTPSESYVANALDCDDEDATVYSGASEHGDGQINNCATGALPANESDDDGDGVVECAIDAGGWDGALAKTGGDCDDGDASEFPGKFGIKTVIRTATVISQSSRHPVSAGGYVTNAADCNDENTNINPGEIEV